MTCPSFESYSDVYQPLSLKVNLFQTSKTPVITHVLTLGNNSKTFMDQTAVLADTKQLLAFLILLPLFSKLHCLIVNVNKNDSCDVTEVNKSVPLSTQVTKIAQHSGLEYSDDLF